MKKSKIKKGWRRVLAYMVVIALLPVGLMFIGLYNMFWKLGNVMDDLSFWCYEKHEDMVELSGVCGEFIDNLGKRKKKK